MPKGKYAPDQMAIQNAAKTLLANIRFASVDNPICSIVVTSSVPDEGKSTVAINLAQAIAQGGKRVLLVECDMRRRSLANMLRIRSKNGLYAVLTEQAALDDAVVETAQPNMFFLDVESHIPNPADVVSSKRFGKFIARLENEFDYVLLDTPPVGTFVDAAIMSKLVDGTIFVVRSGHANRNEILAAFEQLKKADANVIGSVLNFCEAERSNYYYEYYSKDGSRKGSSSSPHGSSAAGEGSAHTASESKPGGKRFNH